MNWWKGVNMIISEDSPKSVNKVQQCKSCHYFKGQGFCDKTTDYVGSWWIGCKFWKLKEVVEWM